MQDQLWDVIAVVPASLEAEAAAELEALGAQTLQPLRRAVRARMNRAAFYRAHLQARLPAQRPRLAGAPFRLLPPLANVPQKTDDRSYRFAAAPVPAEFSPALATAGTRHKTAGPYRKLGRIPRVVRGIRLKSTVKKCFMPVVPVSPLLITPTKYT